MLITIFGALFHGGGGSPYFYGLSALQYYVPTIAALSVLGSCYSQLAIVLAMRRQDGILKRVRATPLPAWAYFLGLLAHCIMISVIDVALITGIGALFGVPLPTHWPAIARGPRARRGQFLRTRRRGRLADPQRRGRASGRAARPVPAGLHLRHLHAHPLRRC